MQSLYKDPSCTHIVFALEGGGKNKRRDIYSEYKANRQSPPEELRLQLPIAIKWIEKMGFLNISIEGYEADDVIASINKVANAQNIAVRIISHDKDLYQLIDENTYIYDPIGKKDIRQTQCLQKYGVYPKNFIDYQSLVGDSSDNVMGVKGIGAKSAQKLIQCFGSIESLYARADEIESITTPRIAKLIKEGKDNAFLSKKLVTLYDDLLDNIDLSKCLMPESNPMLKILDELKEYELKNIISKIQSPHERYNIDLSKCLMPESNPMLKILDELKEYELKNIISKIQSPHERYTQKKSAQRSIGSLQVPIKDSQDNQAFSFTPHLLDTLASVESVLDSMPAKKISPTLHWLTASPHKR